MVVEDPVGEGFIGFVLAGGGREIVKVRHFAGLGLGLLVGRERERESKDGGGSQNEDFPGKKKRLLLLVIHCASLFIIDLSI